MSMDAEHERLTSVGWRLHRDGTYRKPYALVLGPDGAARLREQERKAAEWMRQQHERLLAAGWKWDGMDGYYTDDPDLFNREVPKP